MLDQITALNTVTSNLIESTSEQLKIQGAQINQQAAASTVDVDKLQAAFDNVFATMDAVDTFRAQAVDSMAQTVHALEGQIERAKPYLERTRRERDRRRLTSALARDPVSREVTGEGGGTGRGVVPTRARRLLAPAAPGA